MGKLKYKEKKKRQTTQLKTVIGTDLLTARERWVKNEIGGFYAMADEQAYFKVSSDKSQMTVPEFDKYLKENIDPLFTVVWNPTLTADHDVEGHSIYFHVPQWDAFIPICKVGKSADNIIPANSVGKVVAYAGNAFKASGIMDEQSVLFRGWVAAFEACKLAYQDWEKNGIEPSRAITVKEALGLKQAYQLAGSNGMIKDYVEKLSEKKVIDELANSVKNIEYLKDETLRKFINKEDDNINLFLTQAEYDEMDDVKKKEFFDKWRELTPEELKEKTDLIEQQKNEIEEDLKTEKQNG